MTTAVIFVPAALAHVAHVAHVAAYAAQCLDYCAVRGYEVAGVITTDWPAVVKVLTGGTASVVVVARPDHLDPLREPRIEVAYRPGSATPPPRNDGPVARRYRRPNRV